jgi:2-octaprenyl-6-methoxyphenol hydroxylase
MSRLDFDVVIIGGGPVGCVLALLLARYSRQPEKIALLQADASSQYGYAPDLDPRVLALNHGSRVLLESLQAWPAQASIIQNIHISQKGRLGRTVIRHSDFNVPQLGSVVHYPRLHQSLMQALQTSGVKVHTGLAAQVTTQDTQGVSIVQDGQHFRAALVVQADGHPITPVQREYAQMALLTRAQASLPRKGWAFERFTSEGPLAVLPHPQTADAQSIVWCCAPERARKLASLTPKEFSAVLSDMFGTRLGMLSVEGPVTALPLRLNVRANMIEGRCVAIGNAAQTLHPVAGQGLNLGLRDAGALALALREWLAQPELALTPWLDQFQHSRRPDRQLTALLTDSMARTFTTGLAPVEHLAGLALLGMDALPLARAPLARHLMQGLRR